MSDRQYNEERYNKRKAEGDEIQNVLICNDIADESLMWNPNEAIYWRKLAIEKMEKCYGTKSIESTVYYDKIVHDYIEKGSYLQAEKWNFKSQKIKKEYEHESITNELYQMEILIYKRVYDEIPDIWKSVMTSLKENLVVDVTKLYDIYLRLIYIWKDFGLYNEQELDCTDVVLEIADKAIEVAQKVYGEMSMETAEAYRRKALILYRKDDKEENKQSWEVLNKAYAIATHSENNGKNILTLIEINMRRYSQNLSNNSDSIGDSVNGITI